MKTILTLLIFFITTSAIAQIVVSGKVCDKNGEALVGVNIYFKDTYDGTITDFNGDFEAETQNQNAVLIAQFVGYETYEKAIPSHRDTLNIVLKDDMQSIEGVTVTAGTFAAGDKHKASVMKSLDIYTTAGSLGNITGALNSLPGTQQANDDGRLLVRGGAAYETKTVIDGVLAGKPYFSKVPDAPTRSRFSPSLFSGMMFSTGGYSAEYGQALSSVLVLESNDLFTEDVISLSLMSIGTELNVTEAWKNNSLSITGSYINMAPYYNAINTKYDWEKPTESGSGSIIYRHKTKKNGMLKAYFTGDGSHVRFLNDAGVDDLQYVTESLNQNYYGNVTFRQPIGAKTSLKLGGSATLDNPDIIYHTQHIKNNELNAEARAMLVHDVKDGLKIRYGASTTLTDYQQNYQAHPDSSTHDLAYQDYLTGVFAEAQIQVSKNLAMSTGIRYEYSSLLDKSSLAPRLGIAFATGKHSQVSASYGHFYQNPQSDELKFTSILDFEKAEHYILGYQTGKTDEKFFRVESYYKKYKNLVKYDGEAAYLPSYYSNEGSGDAYGVDVFWRDNESVKFLEYWLSYSYIDTHREYKSFDFKAQPSFVSNHNFSAVAKYWISAIHCQVGATYWLASGRNWYENTPDGKITHQADLSNELNVNLSYITQFFGNRTIIHFSLSNALGNNNVYAYRPGPIRNTDGSQVYLPQSNDVKQFAFLGIFITLN